MLSAVQLKLKYVPSFDEHADLGLMGISVHRAFNGKNIRAAEFSCIHFKNASALPAASPLRLRGLIPLLKEKPDAANYFQAKLLDLRPVSKLSHTAVPVEYERQLHNRLLRQS